MAPFTAAGRPSFDAWRDDFIERKPFTTGSKYLDEVLSETEGRITFQETLMTYFQWLGVTPAESIGLIKKISKKKIHPEDFEALENRLKKKWIENTGSIEHFDTTWQMVQGCMAYGFAAPHALATAIDSLYGAWLKINYPLEYYTTVFGYYEGDMERTNKLTEELNYFGIKLKGIKFRHSSGKYQMDKETNSIYKGIGAVKYCNSELGDQLYALRDQQFDSFLDLLNVFPGNSRQREILIKLGYFEEFGATLKLLKICDLYDLYHGKKLLKKDKINLPLDLVQKYAISETAKQYKFDGPSMDALLREFIAMIPDSDIPLRTRLEAEAEYLGYISYTNPKLQNTGFVLSLETKYSPKAMIYMLSDGNTIIAKVSKSLYQKQAFDAGQILKFYTEERYKSKKGENGEWIKTNEKEKWLTNYIVKQDL